MAWNLQNRNFSSLFLRDMAHLWCRESDRGCLALPAASKIQASSEVILIPSVRSLRNAVLRSPRDDEDAASLMMVTLKPRLCRSGHEQSQPWWISTSPMPLNWPFVHTQCSLSHADVSLDSYQNNFLRFGTLKPFYRFRCCHGEEEFVEAWSI